MHNERFNILFFSLLLFLAFLAFGQWRLSKRRELVWYIGYLLLTSAHFLSELFELGLIQYGPIEAFRRRCEWDTPASYASIACYFFFINRMMDAPKNAPRLSFWIVKMAQLLAFFSALHLIMQAFGGWELAEQWHQWFQPVLFFIMFGITVGLWRLAGSFAKRLVMVGLSTLLVGMLGAVARRFFDGDITTVPEILDTFPTRWGNVHLVRLKAWVLFDAVCFSWALSLLQKNGLSKRPLPRYRLPILSSKT